MTADIYAAYSDAEGGTVTTPEDLRFNGSGEVLGVRLTRPLERRGEFDHQLGSGWTVGST